jgi:hypothetical protein
VNAKQELNRMRAPDERAAEERAWTVVRSAYRDRPAKVTQRPRWRLAIVPALVAAVAAVALSPAGATIGRAIKQALGVHHAARALFSLPAPGSLLLSGPGGTWTVAADGSTRHLGAWPDASWSPHGRYIAVARGDQLAVLDPRGAVRWTVARPAVGHPEWFSPSGYRLAYLSAHHLRIIAGDGTGDHLLASRVAPVAPAWRPGHPYQLAYTDSHGAVVVREADSGQIVWTAHAGTVRSLDWSADGSRLLVLTRIRARVYRNGRMIAQPTMPAGALILDGALSPDGRQLALVRDGVAQDVAVATLNSRRPALRPVLSGPGLRQAVWAPDSRWLLTSWPAADQFVFVRTDGGPRIVAASRIAQQFGTPSPSRGFPQLGGWCCTTPRR